MQIFVPEAGRKFRLSAREKQESLGRLFTEGAGCILRSSAPISSVNWSKHKTRIDVQKHWRLEVEQTKKEADETEKKRRQPSELRNALARGAKLPDEEQLMAMYDADEILSSSMACLDSLKSEFALGPEGEDRCLEGKRILDIGCGSKFTTDGAVPFVGKYRGFEPWLCRALHMCGAKAVGIDIKSNDGERFEHRCADLSEKGALEKLFGSSEDTTFDAVVMMMFANEKNHLTSPLLRKMTTDYQYTIIEAEMFAEVFRLLKDGGLFIHDTEHYRKIGGKLVHVFSFA